MATADGESARSALANGGGTPGSKAATAPAQSAEHPVPAKTKKQNIRVSPAVVDAASKSGEQVLLDLRTSLNGLTEVEAKERARTAGPNEIAQERKQGWLHRLLKTARNPLVILL